MNFAKRILFGIGLGRSSAAPDETQGVQMLQVAHRTGETQDGVKSMQQFGFASSPLPGCDHAVIYAEGDRSKGIAIASNDQRYRPRGMLGGGATVYDASGTTITLDGKGGVTISPASKTLKVVGALQTTGNVAVGTGASGSFTTPTGQTVTVRDGIITNIY